MHQMPFDDVTRCVSPICMYRRTVDVQRDAFACALGACDDTTMLRENNENKVVQFVSLSLWRRVGKRQIARHRINANA